MDVKKEVYKLFDFTYDTTSKVVNAVINGGRVNDFEMLSSTPIEGYCMIDVARYQMKRHMLMNEMQKENILTLFGNGVIDTSHKVSEEVYDYDYSYARKNNYLDNYQKQDAKQTTTRAGWRNDTAVNYTNHNQLYGHTINTYPDELDSGIGRFTESEKWENYKGNRNPDSILRKTKDLFRCRKINTIISSFHTDPTKIDLYDNTESATSNYGLSHGKNLLTYDAERRGRSYNRNGYEDPYCRVWTHHHQYSQYRKELIRPFVTENAEGYVFNIKNENLHKWGGFPNMKYELEPTKDKKEETYSSEIWGWKDKGADGWAYSVLDKNTGMLNIAPKYLGGGEKNIHPKDCMFSIENLAWKDYDPYSFERALSWEQRGPFGGRIMWFPPYGLTFSEDSSVQWNELSFIGRGENVYTYTNTTRTGTLQFMMVVDHPSILDYATWHNDKPSDTDVLRFFAGCDSGDSNDAGSLLSYVKPTPLTDEYLGESESVKIGAKKQETPQKDENVTSDEPIQISFYAFFPNNYSGAFDKRSDKNIAKNNKDNKENVDPIAYLLYGYGTQWEYNEHEAKKSTCYPISFPIEENQKSGRGYEMSYVGITENDSKIVGTSSLYPYSPDKRKTWYYRIDGEYEGNTNDKQNCFSQKLTGKGDNYKDPNGFQLNSNVAGVKNAFPDEEGNENLYSLAEIAYFFADSETKDKIMKNCSITAEREEKINELEKYFKDDATYTVTSLDAVGYSNSHGFNSQDDKNQDRNAFLAKQRGKTVCKWLKDCINHDLKTNVQVKDTSELSNSVKSKSSMPVKDEVKNVNSLEAKKWRSAKVTISINKSKTSDTNNLGTQNNGEIIYTKEYANLSSELQEKYDINEYILKEKEEPSVVVKKDDPIPVLTDYFYEKDNVITKEKYDALPDEEKAEYNIYSYKLRNGEELITFEDKLKQYGFVKVERDVLQKIGREGTDYGNLYYNTNDKGLPTRENRLWYYDKEAQEMRLLKKLRNAYKNTGINTKNYEVKNDYNSLRYDQEYHFFKKLNEKHPDVFSSLVDKLQYFDPAFHSMTPEGFMGRLNFLQQCTRQGDTREVLSENGGTANNLAFGRPPFCILRLGDFYYQKIVINNINITYDPLVLDLNNEGVGVVPLIANVTLSFRFIGGGDLRGPIRRLQNAMSFNYYANGRLYDNRADRVEYEKRNYETNQADINWDNSYFHHVKTYK